MIEEYIMDFLMRSTGISCYLEVPENPEQCFVVIERVGSSKSNLIEHASLAIQSYAETLHAAGEINEAVKEAMDDVVMLPKISAVRLESDYNHTDPTSKRYRYQAVYEITYY